jgi:siroheme synthase-like protein
VLHPELRPALDELWRAGRIAWEPREYSYGALAGYFLAVSATHDAQLNGRIWQEAESRGVLMSAVDDAAHSHFIYPAIHRDRDLIVTVSTSGNSPVLASRLRDRFAEELGPEYARFLELAGPMRAELAARFPDFETRKRIWHRIIDSGVLPQLRAGDEQGARATVASILDSEGETHAASR